MRSEHLRVRAMVRGDELRWVTLEVSVEVLYGLAQEAVGRLPRLEERVLARAECLGVARGRSGDREHVAHLALQRDPESNGLLGEPIPDRKSTRLNSSHQLISY